jgi:ribosomal protein S18 acetylase RimI-like enzyme
VPITIRPLVKTDNRSGFLCEEPALEEWFHRRAGQDERRNLARVFVAVDETQKILGLYSLSSFTVTLTELPPELARRLPRYEAIPAALIGRLARDQRAHSEGVGSLLLVNAIQRIVTLAEAIAIFAIVVESKNDRAAAFYESFGFTKSAEKSSRLFLPLATAVQAFGR